MYLLLKLIKVKFIISAPYKNFHFSDSNYIQNEVFIVKYLRHRFLSLHMKLRDVCMKTQRIPCNNGILNHSDDNFFGG